jgi:hypothetical protein
MKRYEEIGRIGWARISSIFYNCGFLESKGYKVLIGNEYNYTPIESKKTSSPLGGGGLRWGEKDL